MFFFSNISERRDQNTKMALETINHGSKSITIHLVGYGFGIASALREHFAKHDDVRITDGDGVELLYPTTASRVGVAFVSPANSLLFMDGGIDRIYSEVMFKGLQKRLKKCLREAAPSSKTILGRPYLPIASALLVPTSSLGSFLISAPTMCFPQDVSSTHNAYHAFMAALCVSEGARKTSCPSIHTLVCPCMCTGWGCMPPLVAAKQMYMAYVDFKSGSHPLDSHIKTHASHCFFSAPEPLTDQPNYYTNTEFKEIDCKDIVLARS